MQQSSPRHTDVLLGLKCSTCGQPLSLMPGRALLLLQCRSGHSFPMRQMLRTQAEGVERRVRSVLSAWQEKVTVLEQGADFAAREGRDELRQNFLREADSLRTRMAAIREHLEARGDQAGGAVAG